MSLRSSGLILPSDPAPLTEEPVFEVKDKIYQFKCQICNNIAKNDSDMEPLCTGPSWTDDHPPELMVRIN